MKIRYDDNGNINAASLDSFPLGGNNVVIVPDNMDVMKNISNYYFNTTSNNIEMRGSR